MDTVLHHKPKPSWTTSESPRGPRSRRYRFAWRRIPAHMRNFIAYHNPDAMGYPASEIDTLSVMTNKAPSHAQGSRVWLITGEGRPRSFSLCGYFIVDAVEPSYDSRFQTCNRGNAGSLFDSMPCLDAEPWFDEFKRSQGNFSLRFQPITDQRFIAGLEEVASRAHPSSGRQ